MGTLSLSEGCDVAMYIKKLVSDLFFHNGKQINAIVYRDSQRLYDTAHTLKQILEKQENKKNGRKNWNQHYMDRENQTNKLHLYKRWRFT